MDIVAITDFFGTQRNVVVLERSNGVVYVCGADRFKTSSLRASLDHAVGFPEWFIDGAASNQPTGATLAQRQSPQSP